MRAAILKAIQEIRASYWFVPTCMTVGAILLAFVMRWFDGRLAVSGWPEELGWLTENRTEGARAVLSVIAGSIIGVAGVTFSITIVAVSYASANYGPRLIGNFMRDRGNQFTLGAFIGAFVYCIMVLRTVRNASADAADASFDAFVPHLSVLVALALALISVGVLIYFFHHVPESINVANIAARLGAQLREGVDDLFPDSAKNGANAGPVGVDWRDRDRLVHSPIEARRSGYVQALDHDRLLKLARKHMLLVRVQYRPGDFLISRNIVFDVWSEPSVSDEVQDSLRDCYVVGRARTANQNVLYLVDQLVEVIARALSPGVNDPFTAMTCLDWLKVGIAGFLERERRAAGLSEHAPVRFYPISFERLSGAVFDQSLQYVSADRNAALHAMAMIAELAAQAGPGIRHETLRAHLDRLAHACAQTLVKEAGGADVEIRYREAREILAHPDGYEQYRSGEGWFGGRG